MKDIEKLTAIQGLQFMPVLENKKPIHEGWQNTKREYDFSNAKAVGLVCGRISGNVQAIDLDLKYDLTGKLLEEYVSIIKSIDPDIIPKLVIQKTVSNGYHFIFRCSAIDGNQKLANRYTTEEEKKKTFDKSFKAEYEKLILAGNNELQANEMATKVATNSAKNDKVRVLLETRGDLGYIAVAPTTGYKLKQGSFENIQTITPEQRATLFNVAYGFNEVLKENPHHQVKQRVQEKGLSPVDDFNKRGDVVTLLEQHGWLAVGRKGHKVLMKRPGDTKADHSGNFDEERNQFSVFSTSTQFQEQTPYLPYAVFCMLECGGDYSKVPPRLYDLGYGDRREDIQRNNSEIPSSIQLADDDYSFLATDDDYDEYLEKWRTGTFQMGKSTGIPELDKYFLFKEGNLVIINGLDNVGKSTVIWYLSMLSSMKHGWKWLIFSSENHVGSIIRKLIEFYWCENISEMNESKYKIAKKYVLDNFSFIKSGKQLYNYQDIIRMTTKAMKKGKYHALMIDPYNSLKIDIPPTSKNKSYEYHYEAASVLQLFGKTYNIAIYLNCHVGTSGARNKDANGFTLAPQKEDTEMGVMFANKADDFLTVHRITQHETEWNMTEIHVRKIKETETGGKVTPRLKPVKLKMVHWLSGFQHFEYNPVLEWHKQNNGITTPTINFSEPIKEQINADLVLSGNKSGFRPLTAEETKNSRFITAEVGEEPPF